MASISQVVPSLVTASSFSPLAQSPKSSAVTDSSTAVESVIVSLGSTLQETLTFTASGLLVSSIDHVIAAPLSDLTTTVEPLAATNSTPVASTNAAPITTPAAPVPLTPAAITGTATTPPPTVAPVVENTGNTLDTITPLMVNPVVDPAARALADFTANPVYPGVATALYINAANYRSQEVSSAALVSAIDLPGPVSAVSAINVGIAGNNQQPPEYQHGRTAFAR